MIKKIIVGGVFFLFMAGCGMNITTNTNKELEANSIEHQERVTNVEVMSNNASDAINAIKQNEANTKKLSDDELRNKLINAANNIK